MPGYKTSLNKFKKTEIIPSLFYDHNDMKLEISCKKKLEKIHKYMEQKHVIGQPMSQKQINRRRNQNNTLRQIKMEKKHSKIYGMNQKQFQERGS